MYFAWVANRCVFCVFWRVKIVAHFEFIISTDVSGLLPRFAAPVCQLTEKCARFSISLFVFHKVRKALRSLRFLESENPVHFAVNS